MYDPNYGLDIDEQSPFQLPDITQIHGSEEQKKILLDICRMYPSVFCKSVTDVPADVTPIKYTVDDMWETTTKNQQAVRPLPESHRKALENHIETLMKIGVIKYSNAAHYSQIFLVPKPGLGIDDIMKWRIVQDLRLLNSMTKSIDYPIPRIIDMLHNIVSKKPKYFIVLDFTSSFHQIPIEKGHEHYTAFKTHHGIFCYTRMVMGGKNATVWFQSVMEREVLNGVLHRICELYVDDLIIWGETFGELTLNFKQILDRLKEKHIVVNPSKTQLNVAAPEFCGHIIEDGQIKQDRSRINMVVELVRPQTENQMRKFIGLVNFMRLHVQNCSILLMPLQNMIVTKVKNSKRSLPWTAQLEAHFEYVLVAIKNISGLYAVNPDWPVFINTDACIVGYGGYLYQKDPHSKQERPIRFLSKKFVGAQLRWSVPEQECYAIYASLLEWDYLVRGLDVTIFCDHENLTRLNLQSTSKKVRSWLIFIHEFNPRTVHVAGRLNGFADALSRLCVEEEVDENFSEEVDDDVSNSLATLLSSQESMTDSQSAFDLGKLMDANLVSYTKKHNKMLCTIINSSVSTVVVQTNIICSISSSVSLTEKMRHNNSLDEEIHPVIEANYHNSDVGHHGIARVFDDMVTHGLYRPELRQSIARFIKKCHCCQFNTFIKTPIQSIRFTLGATEPWSRIDIDTIGPIAYNGVKGYILVIIDAFSRYVNLFAIDDVSAQTAATKLIEHFCVYGEPDEIHSDKGTQFVNEIISSLAEVHDIHFSQSMAYSKEENGIVERANREVNRYLRDIIFDSKVIVNWKEQVKFVQRIINSSVHSKLGCSPAALIYGLSNRLDRGLTNVAREYSNVPQEISDRLNVQKEVIRAAIEHQDKAHSAHLNQDNNPNKVFRKPTYFPPGSYVLVRNWEASKLETPWIGPYRVDSVFLNKYTLYNLVTGVFTEHHINNLKLFEVDDDKAEELAYRTILDDKGDRYHIVEKIISHKGSFRKISRMQFEVKWKGYKKTTFETYAFLRDNLLFHEYLKLKGQAHKIMKKFQEKKEKVVKLKAIKIKPLFKKKAKVYNKSESLRKSLRIASK
jgi:transposase InsO family protein